MNDSSVIRTIRAFSYAAFVLCSSSVYAQQTAALELPGAKSVSTSPLPAPSAELAEEVYCGDAVSEALHSTSPEMPCWSDIRSVDRFHAVTVPDGELMRTIEDNNIQTADFNRASLTAGFINGTSFATGPNPQGYGGLVAGAMTLGRRRLQLDGEDIASGADLHAYGENKFVGINRAALRLSATVNPRLRIQLRATNTFGTDTYQLFAPLDYRPIGGTQAPILDTAAYGLHAGRVLIEHEDGGVRYAASRRTTWDFSVGHSLRQYSDFGTTVQTLRGRAQVLHAFTPDLALGIFATAQTQTSARTAANLNACTLTGGGVSLENRWNSRVSIDVAAGVASATAGCGNSIQPIGRAALSVRASARSTFYASLERDLGEGVLLTSPLLSSASVGVRRRLWSDSMLVVDGGGLLGTNPMTRQDSTAAFANVEIHYRLGAHLLQQSSVRRYQNSSIDRALGTPGGQTVVTFSLWFTSDSRKQEGE